MADIPGTWACNKDVAVRSAGTGWADLPRAGSPARASLYAGQLGNRDHKSFLNFDWDFGPIGVLKTAVLVVHTSHQDYTPPGGKVRLFRLKQSFNEKSSGTAWDPDDAVNPGYETTPVASKTFNTALNGVTRIDVLPLVGPMMPASKAWQDSPTHQTNGVGKPTAGFAMLAATEAAGVGVVIHSSEATNSAFHPYIEYTYELPELPPNRLVSLTPDGPSLKDEPFVGEWSDPNGDPPYQLWLYVNRKSTGNLIAEKVYSLGTGLSYTESGGIFTWTTPAWPTSELKAGIEYEWRARGKDPSGYFSLYSDPWRSFTRSGSSPTVTTTGPKGTRADLLAVKFVAQWTTEAGETVVSCRLRLRDQGDPWTVTKWDQSFTPMTTGEITNTEIRRDYGGEILGPGTYVWQAEVTDSQGLTVLSDEATLTLTVGSHGDDGGTGPPPNATGYARQKARVRVMLRAANGTNRGPGSIVGMIEDPTNLGFRTVVNSPGEMYFTLPATHPQAGICEPWQTHYAVQQYRNGGWLDVANGWLVDFDAGDNDIIVYGLDYLGALSKTIDHRFPGKDEDGDEIDMDADHAHGGAKYLNKTITHIIKDQLAASKAQPDSNVAFIAEGFMDSLATEVSIYSAFKQRLDFIRGLIASHKGTGSGLTTRLKPRFSPATSGWVWDLRSSVGVDRNNLRLEYGSLLQNFRVIALGTDFTTKAYGIGTKPNHLKPEYAEHPSAGAGGDFWTDTYGLSQTVLTYVDIDDANDLKRRVKQARNEAARVGKQVWVAVRVHGIDPFDGYDLMDSIPLDIDRGMVETDRYGSGYWTIHGTEWRLFGDGHDELSLIIRPKEDTVLPDDDLLPSIPIHRSPEWRTGHGPALASVSFEADAEFYLDVDTNVLYQRTDPLDPEVWTEVATLGAVGGGGAFPGDGSAPPQVTGLDVDPISIEQPDGTFQPGFAATWLASAAPDVIGYEVQWDERDDPAIAATFAAPQTLSVSGTFATLFPVKGGATYDVRVRAYDIETLEGPWSDVVTEVAPGDSEAPAVPENVTVIPGYKMLGVRWDRGSEPDLDHFDVRWAPDLGVGPDVDSWVSLSTASDSISLTNLDVLRKYWVEVRAVDHSDNVRTSLTDDTPVKSTEDGEAGWSVAESGTTLDIPVTDLAVDEIWTEMLTSGRINADYIFAGSLRVGSSERADGVEVYDADNRLQGRWDETGMLMVNPANVRQAMHLQAGELRFSAAFTGLADGSDWDTAIGTTAWTTAVTPLGINVEALTFGSIQTGSNLCPNAGCELQAFSTTADSTKEWTVAGDWDDALGPLNLRVSTGDLGMTTV